MARRALRRTAISSSARRPKCATIFVGAGFNAFGIASGGGAGMALAEWVVKGAPPFDLWPADIRRFGRNHLDAGLGPLAHARSLFETLHDGLAGGGISVRPAAPPFADLRPSQRGGAVFGEKLGWERANWFADEGEIAEDRYTLRAAELVRRRWRANIGRRGRLRRCSTRRPSPSSACLGLTPRRFCRRSPRTTSRKDDDAIIYTQMLNDAGGIEADLTIMRHAKDSFYARHRYRIRYARFPLDPLFDSGGRRRVACRRRHKPPCSRLWARSRGTYCSR